jgi:hypothetical protein
VCACIQPQAVETQYRLWARVIGLAKQESEVVDVFKNLHELLRDVYSERAQQRIDALAIVVSVVGLASICNDAVANFVIESIASDDADAETEDLTRLIYVPLLITFVLCVIGGLFAYWLRQ